MNLSQNQAAALVFALLGLTSMVLFFGVFIFIIQIIARWQVFRKMKVASWKSLIPVYSDFCIWSNVWSGKNYIIYLVITFALSLCGSFLKRFEQNGNDIIILVLSVIIIVLAVVLLIFNIKLVRRYARAFGKGDLMAFALFILPGISEMILGFGMSQYLGNKSKEF